MILFREIDFLLGAYWLICPSTSVSCLSLLIPIYCYNDAADETKLYNFYDITNLNK